MVLRRMGLTREGLDLMGTSQLFSVGTRPFRICGFSKGLARDMPRVPMPSIESESLMKEEGIGTDWSPVPRKASM